jgi:hypothetical protein
MTDAVRMLNDEGIAQFEQYIEHLRLNPAASPPIGLLTDPSTSLPAQVSAMIEVHPFGRPYQSAYELGDYLFGKVLTEFSKPTISREYRLWNWLSLYLFDALCPLINGCRTPLETAAYVLQKDFSYRRYYRHLVRSAWVLVSVHGNFSKVLLTPGSKNHDTPVSVRTDIQMQLSATQAFVESSSVVRTAYALYYDSTTDRLKAGSATKGDGAPRRLVSILGQFDLTYDLHASPTETLVSLMPAEFDRFRGKQKLKHKTG